jgi:hypothetical protein
MGYGLWTFVDAAATDCYGPEWTRSVLTWSSSFFLAAYSFHQLRATGVSDMSGEAVQLGCQELDAQHSPGTCLRSATPWAGLRCVSPLNEPYVYYVDMRVRLEGVAGAARTGRRRRTC